MDVLWLTLAVVLTIWVVMAIVQLLIDGPQRRPVRPAREVAAVLLVAAGVAVHVLILGVQLQPVPAAVAIVVGMVLGYVGARAGGYENDLGDAMVLGSHWYLLPWAAAMLVVALAPIVGDTLGATADTAFAWGMVALYSAVALGVGQLGYSLQAVALVRAYERELDAAVRLCIACFAPLDEGALVCARCGAPQPAYCDECGAFMPDPTVACAHPASPAVEPAELQRFCAFCSSRLALEVAQCGVCGTRQPAACTACGAPLLPEDDLCELCETPVRTLEPVA